MDVDDSESKNGSGKWDSERAELFQEPVNFAVFSFYCMSTNITWFLNFVILHDKKARNHSLLGSFLPP